MFLTLLIIICVIAYLAVCIAFIAIPIIVIVDNHIEHNEQGDAVWMGAGVIILGVMGLLLALAFATGELGIRDEGDIPKQGCWRVYTTSEMVGKTTRDVRHWETIRCP